MDKILETICENRERGLACWLCGLDEMLLKIVTVRTGTKMNWSYKLRERDLLPVLLQSSDMARLLPSSDLLCKHCHEHEIKSLKLVTIQRIKGRPLSLPWGRHNLFFVQIGSMFVYDSMSQIPIKGLAFVFKNCVYLYKCTLLSLALTPMKLTCDICSGILSSSN